MFGPRSLSALLSAPAGIFLAVCFLLPLAGLAWISIEGAPISFAKYISFFSEPSNLAVLRWTIVLASIVTVLCIALAYPVAYLIHRSSKSISSLIYLAVLLPYFTSYLVRTYAWMVLLGRLGPINQLVMALHISEHPLQILYSSSGVVIAMVYMLIPYCVLVIASTMGSIPDQFSRAASSLGASQTQGFFRIFLPLSAPGVAAAGLLTFVFALGFYITPELVGGASDLTIPMLIDSKLNASIDWAGGAAVAVILLAVTIVLYTAANRLVGMEYLLSPRAAQNRSASDIAKQASKGKRLANSYIFAVDSIANLSRRVFGSKKRAASTKGARRETGWFVRSIGLLVCLFLLSPLLIIIPISFSDSRFLTFPPTGFSLQWYNTVFSDGDWMGALWQSFKIGCLAALFSVIVGTGAALSIVKMSSKVRGQVLQFLLAPLIVPSIVGSIALYFLFSKLQIVGTTLALVLAHSVGAVPIVVLIVAAGLQGVDPRLERAAASLGAPPLTALRIVTLPLVARSVAVSAFVAFLHSFDEVVYALFLSGPRLVTLPLKMWSGIRDEISPAIAAVSSLLIFVIVLAYVGNMVLSQRKSRRRSA